MPGRLLRVTSPPMHGNDVKMLQENLNQSWLIPNDRRIKVNESGIYDVQTSHAVANAHYWCGYLGISANADPPLTVYLHGKLPLPAVDRVRREYRLAHRPVVPLHTKALKFGLTLINKPGNIVWNWTGRREQWCVDTVSYIYNHVGSRAFNANWHYSACDALIAAAHLRVNGLTLIKNPVPGCIGIDSWRRNYVPNHAVLIVDPAVGTTIQGNHDPNYIRLVNEKTEGTWVDLEWFILPTK